MPEDTQPGDLAGSDWAAPDSQPPPSGPPDPPGSPTPPDLKGARATLPGPPPVPVAPAGWGGPDQPPVQAGYGRPAPPYGQSPPGAPEGNAWPATVRPGVIPLRPLGLGEVLDGAVSAVRRYPRQIISGALVVAVLATALNLALLLLLPDRLLEGEPGAEELTDAEAGSVALSAIGLLGVATLAGLIASGLVSIVLGKAALGQELPAEQAWAQTRAALPRLLGLCLLIGLALLLTAGLPFLVLLAGPIGVPFVLGGLVATVYLYVRMSLAAPALVLERASVRQALTRSGLLVKGAFWRMLGILVLARVIMAVVGNVLQVPFLFIDGLSGEVTTAGQIGISIGSGLALVVTLPFFGGVAGLLYLDRRMRLEGLDVQLAAASAVPAAHPTSPAPAAHPAPTPPAPPAPPDPR